MGEQRITLIDGQKTQSIGFKPGQSLHDALMAAGVAFDAPCGGNKRCGKCKLRIATAEAVSDAERAFLNAQELASGLRLACFVQARDGMSVRLSSSSGQILTDSASIAPDIDQYITQKTAKLPLPSTTDQRSDTERAREAFGAELDIDLEAMQSLPFALRENDFELCATVFAERCLRFTPRETPMLGLAVDIGTTTVAAYLMDLRTGAQLGVASGLNAQRAFGADVITRSDYAATPEGLAELQSLISSQIGGMACDMCAQAGLDTDDIYMAVFAGNTIMMHLLAGVHTGNITKAPFIPAFTDMLTVKASLIGLPLRHAMASILPCVAGYVGADTVAAALASSMADRSGVSLLLDIGTNGEIALGNRERLLCCSAAAGPAFEGAHIACGMGGVQGAISAVDIKAGAPVYTVLGGREPVGLCGSGLVDAIAALKREGILDETGYLEEEAPGMGEADGKSAYFIAPGVYISQGDIRQVQLAKGAIAAGIDILLKEASLTYADIDRVFLAGGFGNYINSASACQIGLIPMALLGKIEQIGNAAGAGAKAALLSGKQMEKAVAIAGKMRYVELSMRPDFQDMFVENMLF